MQFGNICICTYINARNIRIGTLASWLKLDCAMYWIELNFELCHLSSKAFWLVMKMMDGAERCATQVSNPKEFSEFWPIVSYDIDNKSSKKYFKLAKCYSKYLLHVYICRILVYGHAKNSDSLMPIMWTALSSTCTCLLLTGLKVLLHVLDDKSSFRLFHFILLENANISDS